MHEFALAEDLLKLARTEARKAGITRLDKVVIQVGDLSGVSVDALEFAFGFLREEDDLTRTAELVVERLEGRGRCRECGKESKLERFLLYCPECKEPTIEITQGRDFLLLRLEGENDETEAVPDRAQERAGP